MRQVYTRRGFTITEMALVGLMMSILAIVLGNAWSGLTGPSLDTMIRCQIGQEAQLAAMNLAYDCGGRVYYAEVVPVVGEHGDELQFRESIDGTPTVRYYRDASGEDSVGRKRIKHALIREDADGNWRVVASNVHGFSINDPNKYGGIRSGWVKVNLMLQFHNTGRKAYTWPYNYVLYLPGSIE